MGKQIPGLQTFELADLLQQIEALADETIFAQGHVPFTEQTLCVLITDDHGDDVIDKIFSLGFYEDLEVSIIKQIKKIADDKLEEVTAKQLVKAFNYYLTYDGFYLFDNE